MGAKILLKNQRNYRGEKIADILIKSSNNLKAIKCPSKLNSSSTIDEFLVIFLVAAKAKGSLLF